MVLLTATQVIADAAERYNGICTDTSPIQVTPGEPIPHADVIRLSRSMINDDPSAVQFALNELLKGSQVHVPPAKPVEPKVCAAQGNSELVSPDFTKMLNRAASI